MKLDKSNKRCLFLGLQGLSRLHHSAQVEIMRTYQNEGYEIWLVECEAALLSCRYNLAHDPIMCAKCATMTLEALEGVVDIPPTRRLRLNRSHFPAELKAEQPKTLAGLLDFHYEGVNVGRGVASTMISIMRDSNLDFDEAYGDLVKLQLRNSIGAARNYREILDKVEPDRVILFNGRHVQTFPMVDLCRKRNIWFATHESGGKFPTYQIFRNNIPHSITERQRIMWEMWEADAEQGAKVATQWFEAKRKGSNRDDKVYVAQQKENLLPEGFDHERHNIVVFNSSEDEMKSVPEWKTDLHTDQNDAIRQILEVTEGDDEIMIYLRAHPNLKGVDNDYSRRLQAMQSERFKIIPPESPIHSYDLMASADKVVAFGSTIGVEATFWGQTSVLYGKAFYKNIGAVYEPANQQELGVYLLDKQLPPKPRAKTLPYGYYMSANGIPYRYFEVHPNKLVSRQGKFLGSKSPATYRRILKNLTDLPLYFKLFKLLTGVYPKPTDFGKMFSFLLLKHRKKEKD